MTAFDKVLPAAVLVVLIGAIVFGSARQGDLEREIVRNRIEVLHNREVGIAITRQLNALSTAVAARR